MWQIRGERPEDAAAIEILVTLCFGAGRYAKAAYRLREGVKPDARLGFVAEENNKLLGSVRFWPVLIGGQPSLLLGPLAVQPARKSAGSRASAIDLLVIVGLRALAVAPAP